MAGITDTVRRFIFLKATMFESMPLILTIFVPKNFETSLKYVQIDLVNLTAKGIIVYIWYIYRVYLQTISKES